MTKEMFTAIKITVKLLNIIIKLNFLVLFSIPISFPFEVLQKATFKVFCHPIFLCIV